MCGIERRVCVREEMVRVRDRERGRESGSERAGERERESGV